MWPQTQGVGHHPTRTWEVTNTSQGQQGLETQCVPPLWCKQVRSMFVQDDVGGPSPTPHITASAIWHKTPWIWRIEVPTQHWGGTSPIHTGSANKQFRWWTPGACSVKWDCEYVQQAAISGDLHCSQHCSWAQSRGGPPIQGMHDLLSLHLYTLPHLHTYQISG